MLTGAELLKPTPIRSPAGHAWSLPATEQRLDGILDRIPVSRVYNATALDRLSLPVWAAVTPLARDLKVHGGKGDGDRAARLSAVMEAVERVSAEAVASERTVVASCLALAGRDRAAVLDPELFDLPFGSVYRPDLRCSWVQGFDLLAERATWVLVDLVVSPAREGICRGPETNGLAAGNEPVEAVLHALYEVIERDAAAHQRFARLYGEGPALPARRIVKPDTLPDPAARWAEAVARAGMRLTVDELTHDIGVPVYRALVSDSAFPGREGASTRFEGFGADLDACHAVSRAVCEAVQAHTTVLVGARDTFEGGQVLRVGVDRWLEWLQAPSSTTPFTPPDSGEPSSDLAQRLQVVLERLRSAGFGHCVVVDLTRQDLGVPVVRVLLAGAASPYGETARRPCARLLRALV